ncbi:MAG: hypothetical protein OXE86_18560 [Alphaproteobacteria bacterium]|nr:hypothetical protein [Alphaproteobacteria bacterium]
MQVMDMFPDESAAREWFEAARAIAARLRDRGVKLALGRAPSTENQHRPLTGASDVVRDPEPAHTRRGMP